MSLFNDMYDGIINGMKEDRYDSTKSRKIVWANPEQDTLWQAEMSGQVSDGNWENSSPHNHYEDMCAAESSFDADPAKQGTFGFIPKRGYNFADKGLLEVVGERALFAVKVRKAFPNADFENHWDWEELMEADKKEVILDPSKAKEAYYKEKAERIRKTFNITDEASYNEVVKKIQAVPYTMENMKKDLKQMSDIIRKSKGPREGKVPSDSDKEDVKIKKLTEDEVVKAGDRVTSSDGIKKGAVIALAKDNPSVGIVKWDDAEAEIPVPLSNLKVEEKKIKEDFAEEHGLGKAEKAEPKQEPEHEIENAAVVEPKQETPTITKEYVGKSEDTHFYLVSKDAATGEREDLQIVDQEGIQKYSAKANNLDLAKVDDFIISAIKDVEIDEIERSVFVKYLLPRIEKEDVAEQPEIEKEEEVEELKPEAEKAEEKPEEEKTTESKKVNEETKSFEIYFKDLNDAAQKRLLAELGTTLGEENWEDSPIATVDREMEEKKETTEGKVPSNSDKEDTKIKKLIETKITDEEGNEFEVALVDDGTEDTVIDVNGREFRFSNDFAGLWRDEAGNLSDEGLQELALDALANLEDDVYNELVGVGKAQVDAKTEAEEGGVVGEQSIASEMDESYGEVSIKADIANKLSKEEIIKKIQTRYADIGIKQAEEIYDAVLKGGKGDWSLRATEEAKIATEGKVPDPKDDETATVKKLNEEESSLMKDYRAWVEKEGQLTAGASSVLHKYIKSKGLGDAEYNQLATELGFTESKKDLLSELLDLD